MIKLKELIIREVEEAITFDPEYYMKGKKYGELPVLKDSDTIRVYHGFDSKEEAIEIIKHGLSGKELVNRIYSYESNNNPYGLFVTSVFKVAKQFARNIIIEFTVRVSDLEAPVWPGGSYTVQGQMVNYWGGSSIMDKMREREKGRIKTRDEIMKSSRDDMKFIKLSDRPELANLLLNSVEYQALYTGDLNGNMIRAVWVYEGEAAAKYGTFIRMSRKEFLDKYGDIKRDKSSYTKYASDNIYKPNENWAGIDDYIDRYIKHKKYSEEDKEDIKNNFMYYINNKDYNIVIDTFKSNMYPRQIIQATKELNIPYEGWIVDK